MSVAQFAHLHTHSEYSLLDGAARLDRLVERAADLGMPALALTDHGFMYGAVDFYQACRSAGIRPIIGVEAYLAAGGHRRRGAGDGQANFHMTLLARNAAGYRNLMRLVTSASVDGQYKKPRIDRELLERHREGLIVLSGCLSGELSVALIENDYERALAAAATYRDMLGPDAYYIELQEHGLEHQKLVNDGARRIARELGLQTVCTNDVHYLTHKDAHAHEVLLCIGTRTTLDDPKRMRYDSDQFYLKSAEEMAAAFPDDADARARTLEIAGRCDLDLTFDRTDLPEPDVPDGLTAQEHLSRLAWEGLRKRVGNVTPDHERRLSHELDIIQRTGFAEYILIVRDFAGFARNNDIHFGVRGSAAGSLTSYCVEITDVDPVLYDLTFERFLNIERAEMPDIDMDFEDTRRGEVIEYVTQKYGRDHVAQIATFGTLQARQVLKDAGRALGMPLNLVNRVAQFVPAQGSHVTLDEALEQVQSLADLYASDDQVRTLVDIARRLEGLARHSSVHAAGVVISKAPLVEHTPLQRVGESGRQTQYPAPALAGIGLLKMDFLGLINLSILSRSLDYLRRTRGIDLAVSRIPLDDQATFELLGSGETMGVFQLESSGMRRHIKALKPTSVRDLAAMVALYRPGPMNSIPEFIAAKHGRRAVKYLHPSLEPLLAETYGVIVYQDQVLTVVREIGGFSMGQADLFRRAISKKHEEDIVRMHGEFLAGAEAKGIPRDLAERIYALIKPFARYGFNKAHAVCYALLAYQTAYLKAHYPVEYMAALLACYADKPDKMAVGLAECRRMGVPVLGPDVNTGECDFTPVGEAIRYGLADIKNVGRGAAEAILDERRRGGPFRSLSDFCRRMQDAAGAPRATVETLIKCGAFDSIYPNRRALMQIAADTLSDAAIASRARASGQVALFGAGESGTADCLDAAPPDVPDFPDEVRMDAERELLGVFLSGSPLDGIPGLALDSSLTRAADIGEVEDNEIVTVAGMLTEIRERTTRTKKPMAYARLEDTTGPVALTLFPKVYEAFRSMIVKDAIVRVTGRVSCRDEVPTESNGDRNVEVIVESIAPVERGTGRRADDQAVHIRITADCANRLNLLRSVLDRHPGRLRVLVHVEDDSRRATVRSRLQVADGPDLRMALERIVGAQAVWIE